MKSWTTPILLLAWLAIVIGTVVFQHPDRRDLAAFERNDVRWLREFWDTMQAAGHDTSWSTGTISKNGAPATPYFLYLTTDATRGAAARAALEKAGVLCTTPLAGPRHYPPTR